MDGRRFSPPVFMFGGAEIAPMQETAEKVRWKKVKEKKIILYNGTFFCYTSAVVRKQPPHSTKKTTAQFHIVRYAPVAQLDSACDSDSQGRWFESSRAYQNPA